MNRPLDKLVTKLFSIFLKLSGYKVTVADSDASIEEARMIRHQVHTLENQWSYPDECKSWIDKHYESSTVFLVYHRGFPIATAAIFDPMRANRLYDGFGINQMGKFYEIGGLAIIKEYRSGKLISLLCLYQFMYLFSMKTNCANWIALSSKSFVRGLKNLAPDLQRIHIDLDNATSEPGRLYHKAMLEFVPSILCYSIDLTTVSPYSIAKSLLNYSVKDFRCRFKMHNSSSLSKD